MTTSMKMSPQDRRCQCAGPGAANPSTELPREAAILWRAALAVAIAGAAVLAFLPLRTLLGSVADDAFYYLTIARHLAATGAPTLDGVYPTNGFHPAWMLVSVILSRIFAGPMALLRALLCVSLLCHIVGAALMRRVLTRLTGAWFGLAGAAGWLFNPYAVRIALIGVEGSLLILSVLACIDVFQVRIEPALARKEMPRLRDFGLLGAALAVLANVRTDQIIFVLFTLVFLAVKAAECSRAGKTALGPAARGMGLVVVVVAAGLLPWLTLSMKWVGTVVQDSGVIKHLWYLAENAGLPLPRLAATNVNAWWLGYVVRPCSILSGVSALAMPRAAWLLCAPLLALAVQARRRLPGMRSVANLAAWLAPYALVEPLVSVFTLDVVQVWHTAAIVAIGYVLGFSLVAGALAGVQLAPLALAIVALCPCALLAANPEALYPWQRDVYLTQQDFDRLTPPGAVIGVFNAGIPAYFSHRTIRDLDGLVNHSAIPYYRTKTLDRMLVDEHVGYIADTTTSILLGEDFASRDLSLKLISDRLLHGWSLEHRLLVEVTNGS